MWFIFRVAFFVKRRKWRLYCVFMPQPKQTKRPVTRKKCGTVAGYGAHKRHGELPCESCRDAYRAYMRKWRTGEVGKSREQRQREKEAKERVVQEVTDALTYIRKHSNDDKGKYPAFLKARGRQLWDEVTGEFDLNASSLTVLAECCRMADRAERMAAALASKKTMWFEVDNIEEADEAGVPVVVNGMIGEARQLTTSIRQGLNSIGVLGAGKAKSKGDSVFDELKKRRAKREAANQ